jgi:histidinol-phosphatase (PHP family)
MKACANSPGTSFPLPPDLHVHTWLCGHAEGTPAEYARAAEQAGLPEICFADHAPAPDGYDPETRMRIEQYPLYVNAVREAVAKARLTVRFGIEADYYEGCEKFLADWLPRQDFDLVIGSVHFIGDWAFDNPAYTASWQTVDVADAWRRYFALVGRLADSRLYDVVGHLDLPKKFGHKPPSGRALREMAAPALDRIAAAGMAIELNTSGLWRPVAEIFPNPELAQMAFERNIPICFGSDAHSPKQVGYRFAEAVTFARQLGYARYARFEKRRRELAPIPLPL